MLRYLLILIVIMLQACAAQPRYIIEVDAISAPEQSESKTQYYLSHGMDEINVNDLQYQEFASIVDKGLISKGFEKASNLDEAEIIIFLSYGISEPNTQQFTYSVPVYGETGISSKNTTGTINSYGNTSTYNGTTTYNKSYGIAGYRTQIGTRTTYFRYILLEAFDLHELRDNNNEVKLWKTYVTSTGESSDLRGVLPLLVVASCSHFGGNTGKKLVVNMKQKESPLEDLKCNSNKK